MKVLRHFSVAIIFDGLFFLLQGQLKNILSLEPLMKLATFVVAEVIYQNGKKKVTKIITRRRSRRCQKRCTKTPTFFLLLLFHI